MAKNGREVGTVAVRPERVRALMAARHWSEKDLAEAIGVNHSQVNRVLNGRRRPGAKFIAGMLSLGISFDEVFYYDPSGTARR
jgi:transcriptional regulator with XRE-family HTH domain